MSAPEPPSDPGLAHERTLLAWNRSGLAVIVCIAVLLRRVWPLSSIGRDVALGLIAAAAIMWAIVLFMLSASRSGRTGPLLLGARVFSLMTAGTLALAA